MDKDGEQKKNASASDHVNVMNMYVMLSLTRYLAVDYHVSFKKQQFSRAYGDAASFKSKFYCMDELMSNPNITPSDYEI